MAADQRKKRLNAAGIVGCSAGDKYKLREKKLRLSQYDLNVRSNISLEWDDKKCVVAKREQIGISLRDLIPFVGVVPRGSNILADVITVPREIFEIKNLTEMLSYEVWQTHLSENERDLLAQFLPKGAEPHKVVHELLAGENFYFGNPFLKWCASLCSGNLHPDAVLHRERCYTANKKAYYSELRKYHNDLIGNLQTWKGRWASCKDPEKEFVQKIWRPRKYAEKSMPTHENDSFHGLDENFVATSESGSWAADEKACSSDDPDLMMIHGEPQRRKVLVDGKYDNTSNGLKVLAIPRKGEKLHKRNIQRGDGAKYMSYIKVSKEQHQLVKSSMKHLSNSIKPRSLNNVLGNLNTFHVQPFEVFEEEERQKQHEHWLQLANRDLPAGLTNWTRWQLQKQQLTKSLEQEMKEKLKSLKGGEVVSLSHNVLPKLKNGGAVDLEPTMTIEDAEKENSDTLFQEQMDNVAADRKPIIVLEDAEKESPDITLQEKTDNEATNHEPTMEDDYESLPACTQNECLQQITSHSGSDELHGMDLDSDNNHVIAKIEDIPPNISEYSENLNHVDIPVRQGGSITSASDVWPAVDMPGSYYHSTSVNNEYASDLALRHQEVIEEQPIRLIDLESHTREQDSGKGLLHNRYNMSFFSPYPNQDRSELIQSLFKGQGSFPYHREQKQTELDFHPAASVMMETGQFCGQLEEQLHQSLPLELRQKRLNDLYMHRNIQENMYSNGGRYSTPRQQHFSPTNIQDWTANTVRTSTPPQSHLNGGQLPSQNWFSGNDRACSAWSGTERAIGTNQSIGNGSSSDQSLFSVLSQCNELRSGAPYDSMGSNKQFIQPENYDGDVPTRSNELPQTHHPFNYFGGHEAAGLKANNSIELMGLLHQDSALQDSLHKPFLRSWNP